MATTNANVPVTTAIHVNRNTARPTRRLMVEVITEAKLEIESRAVASDATMPSALLRLDFRNSSTRDGSYSRRQSATGEKSAPTCRNRGSSEQNADISKATTRAS